LERRYGAEVEWVPFDLHPEYPPEGIPRASLEGRYGEDFSDHVQHMIEDAGFKYDPPAIIPRSTRSLELAELARDAGRFRQVHQALFEAYWSRGLDIGNIETLLEIGAQTGMDRDTVQHALADGRYRERIASTTQVAYELGLGGVPAWLIDDKLVVSGAQPHEAFGRGMSQLGYEPLND
jgi:predicted DsbA family dithiol-disulfide isomerase